MTANMPEHIEGLLQYLSHPKEKANEDLILKYFRHVYGEQFARQQDAKGADGYVCGHFVVELKGASKDWLSGLFQGIAYQSDLDFSLVVVAAKHFLAVWNVDDIDEVIREEILVSTSSPSTIGKKLAKKYRTRQSEFLRKAIWQLRGELTEGLFAADVSSVLKEVRSFEQTVNRERRVRSKITTRNFITTLKEMAPYFSGTKPIKAVTAFYSMVFGWEEYSLLQISERNKTQATLKGESIDHLVPGKRIQFKSFVEQHYIYLREHENVDDFFAQYDRAIDSVDPNFRRTHGIYFTDIDLSKFVMWFVRRYEKELGDVGRNYLVIDPACGSGNLVTNWRSPLELRHKVVSEIEPELLYTVEQRMKGDAWHNGKFTVVPKVEENKGLNFLDKDARDYIEVLKRYLIEKNHKPDKPLAFLCNPPYRSDDDQRAGGILYEVHPSILNAIGNDAGAERYCCFLAQMKLICEAAEESGLPGESLLLIFTKSAWMTRRPTFSRIRREIFGSFEDVGGLIVNGKEFFDVSGSFPVAFTIWKYVGHHKTIEQNRAIRLYDLTWLKNKDLAAVNWDGNDMDGQCDRIMNDQQTKLVEIGNERQSIRAWAAQSMVDFKRSRRRDEMGASTVGGLPRDDRRNRNRKAYGEALGEYVGFMDDLTPCRVKRGMDNTPWFRLNSQFMDCRKTRCFSGPPDNRGYAPEDDASLKRLFTWFALGRTFATHRYPMWVDADEMWPISIPRSMEARVTKICFAVGFAENECISTVFPANNPVQGAKEVYVGNPMTPLDPESFWTRNMSQYFDNGSNESEDILVASVKRFYELWANALNRRSEIYVSYERPYFLAENMLTRFAGLVQIKDYAKETDEAVLLEQWDKVQRNLKRVKKLFNGMLHSGSRLNYFSVHEKSVLNRALLASYVVNELNNERTFGRVKFTKLFYLLDTLVHEDLGTTYYREAAGPLDPYSLYNEKTGIEKTAREYKYFYSEEELNGARGTRRMHYRSASAIEDAVREARKLFSRELPKMDHIINVLRKVDTERCEIVATLYACWNDMLIDGRPVTDESIIDEFTFQWHKEKKRFGRQRLSRALRWMKDKGIVPHGRAPRTVAHRPPNQDDLFESA